MSNATGRFSTRWDPKRTKPKGPPPDFHRNTSFDCMTPKASAESEIANYERLKASRPLKPPKRRQL